MDVEAARVTLAAHKAIVVRALRDAQATGASESPTTAAELAAIAKLERELDTADQLARLRALTALPELLGGAETSGPDPATSDPA
jgi:hypothetical protein